MGRHRGVATLRKILFARRRPRPAGSTARTCFILMTDGPTGTAHLVTDEAFANGRHYLTICEMQVVTASLPTPARRHCSACERGGPSTRNGGGGHGDR
ncbi:MAG: hypothetical protein ACRDTG_21610 [Pseudonocardiaceae bacterium]